MKTYLRIVNPIVAVVVLLLCIWAGMKGENGFHALDPLQGGIPTYFLAKGLFCCSALILIGRVLLIMGGRAEK